MKGLEAATWAVRENAGRTSEVIARAAGIAMVDALTDYDIEAVILQPSHQHRRAELKQRLGLTDGSM